MYSEKSTWRLFKNFKSQCSVTKHIIPLIKLTYYTYEWYCLETLEPQLLKVQSQQGNLWDTWNYIYIYIYTLYNPDDFRKKTKLMITGIWKHPKSIYYLGYTNHLYVKPRLPACRVSQ